MAQPFYARKIDLNIGPRKGETVYSAQAYYYGTITTKQVATQIAQESALTPADVIGVIERLAYFCQPTWRLVTRSSWTDWASSTTSCSPRKA